MKRILLFTNILTPYRSYFYDLLYKYCNEKRMDFKVLVMSRTEENRNWNYEDFERTYTNLLNCRRIKIGSFKLNLDNNVSQFISAYNPDFIIAAGSYVHPCLWKLISIANNKKIPIFFWSESHLNTVRNYSRAKMLFRNAIRKFLYRRFDGFFYAGKLSENFIDEYCRQDAYKIFLPNLVDNEFYSKCVVDDELKHRILKDNNLIGYDKILLCPARLNNDKGLLPFIDLLAKIKTKVNYVFCIAGDGELFEDIKSLAEKKQVNVRLLGYKEQEEMRIWYQISDGFVLPSKVDPNPLTCIEALWSGLPILVSSNVGNNPEVVLVDQNGYVFNYKQESQSLEIIKKYIEADCSWLKNARTVSLRNADKMYNSQTQVQRIIDEIGIYCKRA